MSSSLIPRRAALLGLLALSGCGFAPVYGDGGALRGMISFQTDEGVAGYRMREQLERRLGPPQSPRYSLRVTQNARQTAAAITSDGDTVRFNVIGKANWVLTNIGSGVQVASGTADGFSGYSATGSTVATQAANTDARARLSTMLADIITSRLLVLAPRLTP